MVSERKIREDHNVSAILLTYSIFSNRNQLSLFSRRACDKVITMTGKKKVGCPCSLVSYSHFSTDRAQYVWVIDQVWGKDGWMLAKFFFCVFMDRDEVEVHKRAKKERGQYPAILTEQTLLNKGFIMWLLGKICLRDTAGSQSQRVISFILPARGASHVIITRYWNLYQATLDISIFEHGSETFGSKLQIFQVSFVP